MHSSSTGSSARSQVDGARPRRGRCEGWLRGFGSVDFLWVFQGGSVDVGLVWFGIVYWWLVGVVLRRVVEEWGSLGEPFGGVSLFFFFWSSLCGLWVFLGEGDKVRELEVIEV